MSKQTALAETIATKRQAKTQLATAPLPGVPEFVGKSLLFSGKSLPANWLGDSRFPAIQRQILARQIGEIQGNSCFQEAITFLNRNGSNTYSPLSFNTNSAAKETEKLAGSMIQTKYGNGQLVTTNTLAMNKVAGKESIIDKPTLKIQKTGKQHVQKEDFTAPISFRERLFSRWFKLDPGNSLTVLIDAKRDPEDCDLPKRFAVYLYSAASKGYQPPVSYPVDNSAQYTWKGLKGGAYQLILKFTERVAHGCQLTGTLEVKQESAVENIVPTAKSHVGSTQWAISANRPPYGPGTNKCNLFVYEALNDAGAAVPLIQRYKFGIIRRDSHPPLAGQWADPSFSIAGWNVVSSPKPGDVIAEAHQYSDASGHVGIVSSAPQDDGKGGASISAATSGSVVETDWGFRSGQKVVFRRYAGR